MVDEHRLATMVEATRLTRQGQLAEATALIQRTLGNSTNAGTAGADPGSSRQPDVRAPLLERARATASTVMSRLNPTGARAHARQRPATAPGNGFHFPAAQAPTVTSPGQFLDLSYANAAGERRYRIYVPTGYGGDAVPLVVMLHGGTQSADDFAAGTRMNALAELRTFLVAYPEQARSANAMGYWNWFQPSDQQRGAGEPSLIAEITHQVMHAYSVDPDRVYIAGFSAGGAMAAVMAATYPDLYAAAGIHSGLAYRAAADVPSAFAAMRQGVAAQGQAAGSIPLIVFHGACDPTVDHVNADCIIDHRLRGTTRRATAESGQVPGGHSYRRVVFRDAAGQTLVEQWTVQQAGHAWSGGSLTGSYTDPQGPDASAELVRFFGEHASTARVGEARQGVPVSRHRGTPAVNAAVDLWADNA